MPEPHITDEGIFPLPLAPFEAYMLADHRDDYPMQFYFRMTLLGQLERESFREALAESVQQHPLLRAKVRHRFGRSPVWESVRHDCLRECRQPFDDLTEVVQTPCINLAEESGLRTWLYENSLETQLLFEFHHSCCDGQGALIFLEDVLVAYNRIVSAKDTDDEFVHDSGLKTRAAIPLTVGQAIRKIPLDVKDFFRIVLRRPAIASADPDPETECRDVGSRSSFLNHRFSSSELNDLLTAARSQSATLNSLLMKEVYLSLDQWMSNDGDPGHRWIRMGVPASTRLDDSTAKTCCNQVTIMFLDEHSSDIRNAESLLNRVAEQTRFHRDSKIWYSMLQLLRVLATVPPLLRLYLRANRRMCTTITSNVGRAFETCPLRRSEGSLCVGDMCLKSLDFMGPLRPGTEVVFGAVTYADTLSICMHYKPQSISDTRARELFERLVRNIRTSTQTGSA